MDQKLKTYEGMFLLESGNSDFESASEPVRNVLGRSQAEVLAMKPWDERKLAYDIKKHRRALYVLTYFKADPGLITEIENDCQLDERIIRMLIIRRDRLTDEEIAAETPATVASARRSAQASEPQPDQAGATPKPTGEPAAEAPAPTETKPTGEPAAENAPAPTETKPDSEPATDAEASSEPVPDKTDEGETTTQAPQPTDEAQTETPTTEEKPETT